MARKRPEVVLSCEEAKAGARLAATNARGLLDFAEAGAKCQRFGPAISLCILASEEGAKALALFFSAISPEPAGISLKDVLSKHSVKHQLSQLVSFGVHLFGLMFSVKNEVQRAIDHGAIDEQGAGGQWVRRVTEELSRMTHDPSHEVRRFMAWYQVANGLKNEGLYVDWLGDTWHDPNTATSETFAECRRYVEWWLLRVDELLSISDEEWARVFSMARSPCQKDRHSE